VWDSEGEAHAGKDETLGVAGSQDHQRQAAVSELEAQLV